MVVPFLGALIGGLLDLALLALTIMGIIHAASGEEKKLPVIGDLAEKINI